MTSPRFHLFELPADPTDDDLDAAARDLAQSDCAACDQPATFISHRLVKARNAETGTVVECEVIVPLCDACRELGARSPALQRIAKQAAAQELAERRDWLRIRTRDL